MYTIVPADKCTGCGVCYSVCNKDAISMQYDENGFLFPQVDFSKCVHCDLCKKACPTFKEPNFNENTQEAFCTYNKDSLILKESTSGGVFTSLAKYVLKQDGVVYGVEMKAIEAIHICIEKEEDLAKLWGSKYIQSVFILHKEIEKILKEDRLVLFSGTPCQIDGLRHFLKNDYANLITCEVACYGVGSKRIFDDYLKQLISKNNKPTNIYFRKKTGKHKPSSFVLEFDDYKSIELPSYYNYFGYLFSKHLICRESCLDCRYSDKKRVADFSLGDYSEPDIASYPKKVVKNGLSLFVVNTEKGKEILSKLDDLVNDKKNYDLIKSGAFNKRNVLKRDREEFFIEYNSIGIEKSLEKYKIIIKKELLANKKNKVKNKIKSLLMK